MSTSTWKTHQRGKQGNSYNGQQKKKQKKQRILISLEENHQNFIAAVRKREMLAATKVKMGGSEKKGEQEHIQHFLHKTRFWRFHLRVV